ncbi:MAG: type II toxin-antitoxin system RelE/ParE family toxin [Cytophagales bacterium]|nr:type II toxin-antitoxin system RelE/ParE family toxin [Cytophagales bacterium]
MKIKIALRAAKQMEDIYAYYVLNESINRADKVINSFFDAFEACAQNPYIFPKAISTSDSHHIRKGVIHSTYTFRYHIYKHHIRIISIIHGKRNI